MKFGDFVDRVYLPWAKTNKRSWKDDEYKLPVLKAFFHNTSLRDITPFSIERFKQTRLATPTKHKTTSFTRNRQPGDGST